MSDHDMFDVMDVTKEDDAVALAVFYRDLLGAVSDVENMLAGYMDLAGVDTFTVGSVTIQWKPGPKSYDHKGAAEELAASDEDIRGKFEAAVELNTEPKTSWSRVTKALGLKTKDIRFNQGPEKLEFIVRDTKVQTVPWEDHPDNDPDNTDGNPVDTLGALGVDDDDLEDIPF